MISGKLPQSLVVEIPLQENLSQDILEQIIVQINENYRTSENKNQTILAGNKQAGGLVYELAAGLSGYINACLLFDANLPVNPSADNPEIAWYLDISDKGVNFKNYHSLYLSLRENEVPHEYRVRQGAPSHQSFLNGVFASTGFMKDHLNSKSNCCLRAKRAENHRKYGDAQPDSESGSALFGGPAGKLLRYKSLLSGGLPAARAW